MAIYGPDRASVDVFVFREGLLSAAGYDLFLRARDLEIVVDPAAPAASARIAAASLRVVTAMRGGRPFLAALSASDEREIEATAADTVLRARQFPEIRFASSAATRRHDGWDVRGSLTLAGVTREIAFAVRRTGERLVAEATLRQPDFGIAPYRAMLGALRVKPAVVVRVGVPANGL